MAYQKRYIAYASAHGRTPEAQLHHDKLTHPGGFMAEYVIWIGEQIVSFRQAHPEAFSGSHLADHAAFDNYLAHITK